MEGYDEIAALYNRAVERDLEGNGFCKRIAPWLLAHHRSRCARRSVERLIDLGCGTGQLAICFAQQGFEVLGIDCSREMLEYARRNAEEAGCDDKITWRAGDICAFEAPVPADLVTATYNVINHLPDANALRATFRCAYQALLPNGVLLFDMNTERHLQSWNHCSARSWPAQGGSPSASYIVRRTTYESERRRALRELVCFHDRHGSGEFRMHTGHTYNYAYATNDVRELLTSAGFADVCFYDAAGPDQVLRDAEAPDVVIVTAYKPASCGRGDMTC